MTEVAPIVSPGRRLSLGVVIGIAVIALLAGAAITVFALRWLRPAPQPVAAASQPQHTIVAPVATDPATLNSRQETLGAEVSALEQRTAQISGEAATASAYANRAEALMVAFAARRAIDRGVGLGYLEQQLRDRFGGSRSTEVDLIIRASRDPVTSEDLRLGIDTLGPQLAFGPGDEGWLDAFRRQLASLIVIHKQGMPSPAPAERLERIRRLLAQRQVEAAIAEVQRLPGGEQATRWMTAAKRYVDAHNALDTLEATALQGGVSAPSTPSPAAPAR